MAHEFETGFVVREKAWHGLATVLPENPSVQDALRLAGLDWEVLEQPLHTDLVTADGVARVEVQGWKALMRATDRSVLGVVTERFKPFQNRQSFSWFQALVDDGTCQIVTAGALQMGRKVWVQAKYADAIEVRDGDAIVPYLLLANGHDGKMSLRLMNTPIRVVCWNTMQASGATEDGDVGGESEGGIAISHQGDIAAKAAAARNAIVAMNRELKMTVDVYRRMVKLPVTEEYVRLLAKELWDRDYIAARDLVAKFRQRQEHEAPSVREETARKIAELEAILATPGRTEQKVVEAFHNSPGCQGKTAWDAFNAITYQIDHGSQGSADTRLTSSWFGNGSRKRAKAFQLISASV